MIQEIHNLLLTPFNTERASFSLILIVIEWIFYCGLKFVIHIRFYTCNLKNGHEVEMDYVFTS